jgi:hypothetical protein
MNATERAARLNKITDHVKTLNQAEKAWLGWQLVHDVGHPADIVNFTVGNKQCLKCQRTNGKLRHTFYFNDESVLIIEGAWGAHKLVEITNVNDTGIDSRHFEAWRRDRMW